ncbi:hypothetical protein [Mycetocola reblochoni]|uniref:Glucose-6-phosphate 1-dehydrogenase n=2 Tax=Mycetocola reblochoni TaxID=331618 RepID=A0A1R4JNM9_9MICO|nr:hypothetical protein [Mycetocola reblochoni]RLP68598.1 hypothetical protein D9V30_10015 [Mycetocola reblochoni]SJN33395.1 Glucose-6-phosphate 1-dehydrogenase [Mycetocola reblochoni REB411]
MATPLTTLALLGVPSPSAPLLTGAAELLSADPGRSIRIIGVGPDLIDDARWQAELRSALEAAGYSRSVTRRTTTGARWVVADPRTAAGVRTMLAATGGRVALHLDTPHADTLAVLAALREHGVPSGLTLSLSGPFGTTLRTARALNRALQTTLPDSRTHRIDPGLSTDMLTSLLGLRFGNRLFEPLLGAGNIARIEIVREEPRAQSPDECGPLAGVVQTELLHLLGVLLMEPPSSLGADELRGGLLQVLRATSVAGDGPGASRRARYLGGTIDKVPFPAFTASGAADTETLAEVNVQVDTWRWAGVPIVLRAGRALSARHEILITLKDPPRVPRGLNPARTPSTVRIGLDPAEVQITLGMSGGPDPYTLEARSFATAPLRGSGSAAAQLLEGVLSGDTTLSLGAHAVEEGWRIVTPVLNAWQRGDVPMDQYRPGGTGPSAWR